MKLHVHGSIFRTFIFSQVLIPIVIAAVACAANGQPTAFVENFTGPVLDPAWTQLGDPAGHPTVIAGSYDITDAHGQPGTSLRRSTGGTVSSFTHEIELVLNPHLLMGSGGTQSDFKFRSSGADGVLDVVYNSFGHLRVNHADFNTGSSDHIAGGSPNNITIGYTDGDTLKLRVDYHGGTDTIDVTYALNGGTPVSVYSGTGIDGQFGDVITSSVEVLVFKFGNSTPTQTVAAIDNWSLGELASGTPGDFDVDGDVDGADFLIWQRGESPLGGTSAELADWQNNYGPNPLVGATSAVPEPSCMLLMLTSTALLGLRRNGWRRH